jgi:2,4-dienoyl-CoA reductase-like NADH-dependent reductase (Old Yellow Enzyme family)
MMTEWHGRMARYCALVRSLLCCHLPFFGLPQIPLITRPSLIMSATPPVDLTALWQRPLQVGDLTLKNRVLFSPCTRNRGNVPTARQAHYYAQRASAGLIVSEGTLPSPQGYEYQNAPGSESSTQQRGRSINLGSNVHVHDAHCLCHPCCCLSESVYSAKQIAGWKLVTDAVHAAGGIIFCQIMHIGRVANPLFQAALPPVGPSAVAAKGGKFKQSPYTWVNQRGEVIEVGSEYVVPEEIEDTDALIELYRTAFQNCQKAGFDGVELHGGNGYLMSQFLDAGSNIRTDEFGGSPEKRCRMVLDVLDVAIDIWGAGRVGIKLTPEGGLNDQGMPLDELLATFRYLFSKLHEKKIAYVEIQRFFTVFDPTKRGTIVPVTEWRKYYPGTLFLNGQMAPTEAAELLSNGFLMSTPDLVDRLSNNLPLNSFDWSTAFSSGDKGYADYKTWAEQSEEEQAETTKQWAEYLKYLEDDKETTLKLYAQQEADAGRAQA